MVEQLLRMSLTASIVILIVLIVRVFMRKLPKKFSYMLWIPVGFRLLCPVSVESKLSIFNSKPASQATSHIESSRIYANYVTRISPEDRLRMAERTMRQTQKVSEVKHVASKAQGLDIHSVMMTIWIIVAALIIGYAIYHLISLKIMLRGAKKVEKGIYESPLIASPFAMGFIRPGIYLPVDLPELEREYLIEHERTHIRRGDLIFKMLAVTALALHWFNPLVWVAFVFFCRDMEMSCDEIVLEHMGADIRKNYSLSLVTLASKSQDYSYVVMSTSFSKSSVGKNEVKMRIKNIMSFRKSSRSAAAFAGIVVISVMLTCILNACAPAEDNAAEQTTTFKSAAASSESSSETEQEIVEETVVCIEGQDEYMMQFSSCTPNQDLYDGVITDASVFEDENIRELAQYYLDQGYILMDESSQIGSMGTLGDSHYIFDQGFLAYINGEDSEEMIWVYKMNEELFDYYLVEVPASFNDDEDEVTDDGTVIRYVDNSTSDYMLTISEFNRDTGIGTHNFIWDLTYYDQYGTTDIASIEDPTMRSIAQRYADEGYLLMNFNPEEYFMCAFEDADYPYGTGVRAFWQDQETCIGHTVFIMQGDDEVVDTMIEDVDDFGVVVSREDDGSVLTVTMEYFDFGNIDVAVFELDRNTGILTIYMECPYNSEMFSGSMGACTENEYNDLITRLTIEFGDPVSTEDDGRLVRTVYALEDCNYVVIYDREQHMVAEISELND